MEEHQIIIYGASGTGKSYTIDNCLRDMAFDTDNNVIRVVFHRDYTYADFIGGLAPVIAEGNTIQYRFQAGAFSNVLQKALAQPEDKVCLLIEELNRGNCAAIFGDIFQLLDREKQGEHKGESEYTIMNMQIRDFLNEDPRTAAVLQGRNMGENDIFLPDNLYLWATTNTSDQNVFPMDTAFKRRFKMRYMPIDLDTESLKLQQLNRQASVNLFDGLHTWTEFAGAVNALIDSINYRMPSISEDKKLGPYFADAADVSCRQAFCDKVLFYLKNDVFKYNNAYFKDSYEEIYEFFVINRGDIFDKLREN